MRVKLELALKPLVMAKAKANQKASGGAVPLKTAKPVNTRKEIANEAGVSADTVSKVEKVIASGNEAIDDGDEVKQSTRS